MRGREGKEIEGEMQTYLGLMRCLMVPKMARRTKSAAVATYAHPRKGFFPPIQETVEMTNDFVPEYGRTGKSGNRSISIS